MFSIFQNLETARQYSASTGLTKENFKELEEVFKTLYQPKSPNRMTGESAHLSNSAEALFFILWYLKTYPTWQNLGLQFGFSDTTAGHYIAYILPFLKASLAQKEALAYRVFESQAAFNKAFEGVTDIFIDGTEIPIERAENDLLQKKTFSGKKNFTH